MCDFVLRSIHTSASLPVFQTMSSPGGTSSSSIVSGVLLSAVVGTAVILYTNKVRPRWMWNERRQLKNPYINPLTMGLFSMGAAMTLLANKDKLAALFMMQRDSANRLESASIPAHTHTHLHTSQDDAVEDNNNHKKDHQSDTSSSSDSDSSTDSDSSDSGDDVSSRQPPIKIMKRKYNSRKQRWSKRHSSMKTAAGSLEENEPFPGPMRADDSSDSHSSSSTDSDDDVLRAARGRSRTGKQISFTDASQEFYNDGGKHDYTIDELLGTG